MVLDLKTEILYELSIFGLFLLSAFFSGLETSIVSSSRMILESISNNGSKSAGRALSILDNIEDAMGMILIGNNIANIAATAFITFIATRAFMLDESRLLLITMLQTIIFLIFCEISPKLIARAKCESYLMTFSYPIMILMFISKPLIKISLFIANLIKRLLRIKEMDKSIIRSKDEIDLLFKLGEKEGIIDEDNQQFISEILSFKDIKAYEAMTPMIDFVSIEINSSIKDLIQLIFKTKFARIPIYEDRVDNIIGYVFYRDILLNKDVEKISDLVTKPYYIPSTKNIFDLYQEMYEKFIPVFFVVNEFGSVTGMVTNEDIAEEVVGEIQTSDHPEEDLILKVSDQKYIISGSLDVDFFNRRFPLDIKKKGFETFAGFITYHLKKIPKKGERLNFKKYSFIIEEVTERSVEKVVMLLPRKRKS